MITEESIWQEYEEFLKSGKEIIVEHISLEELNQLMVENGLDPINREARNSIKSRSSCSSWGCANFPYFADANSSGSVTGADIVYIRKYFVDNNIPLPAPPGNGEINPTNDGSHPSYIVKYGYVSAACDNTDAWVLDFEDESLVTDYILGFICL